MSSQLIWYSLQWRHNERDGVSNHKPHDCLLNRLFRRRSKKTSKLRVTGLCEGNSPVTDEFPAQRASNTENVSIWWRHHARGNQCFDNSENRYNKETKEIGVITLTHALSQRSMISFSISWPRMLSWTFQPKSIHATNKGWIFYCGGTFVLCHSGASHAMNILTPRQNFQTFAHIKYWHISWNRNVSIVRLGI